MSAILKCRYAEGLAYAGYSYTRFRYAEYRSDL